MVKTQVMFLMIPLHFMVSIKKRNAAKVPKSLLSVKGSCSGFVYLPLYISIYVYWLKARGSRVMSAGILDTLRKIQDSTSRAAITIYTVLYL